MLYAPSRRLRVPLVYGTLLLSHLEASSASLLLLLLFPGVHLPAQLFAAFRGLLLGAAVRKAAQRIVPET